MAEQVAERVADQVDLEVLRRLSRLSARINAGQRLEDTLQAVADGVVEALGFGCAAVNFRMPDGSYQVLAVNGPPEARAALAGQVIAGQTMDLLLASAESWGRLRYIGEPEVLAGEQAVWTPTVRPSDDPDAWLPHEVLLAPLCAVDGTLEGVLSVDMPPQQRRPNRVLCEMLEMFAVSAGAAILNARLTRDLQRKHDRLQASEAAFRFAFESSAGAMGVLCLRPERLGRFLLANDALARTFGHGVDELCALDWQDLVVENQRPAALAVLAEFADGSRPRSRQERQMVRGDGTEIWVDLTGTVIDPGDGQPPFLLLHLEDITARKSAEEMLVRHAHVDPLTGLANRRVVYKYLSGLVDEVARTGAEGRVVFCDLDGFKQINDNYGHATGDLVLQEAAARLTAQVRTTDVVGRVGGDEFVVVAMGLDEAAAGQLMQRLREAFTLPLTTVPEMIDLSLGCAVITGREDAAALLDNADQAMYADKHRSRTTS